MTPHNRALEGGRLSFGSGWTPTTVAVAPGRLELLGNHVDYNGGLVLAGAIDRTVAIVAGENAGQDCVQIVAVDVSSEVATIAIDACRDWRNDTGTVGPFDYARGVIASLIAREHPVRGGLQLAIAGDVPLGFGMSSSAALCVALVLSLSSDQLDPLEMVAVAREAEHRCGNPVGAMDQAASVAGGIIFFDGRDASFSTLSPDLGDYVFTVAASGVTHALGESSYPTRVTESQQALAIIRAYVIPDIKSLGQIGPGQWDSVRTDALPHLGPVLDARVAHVVSEVARVRRGVDAVHASDWTEFGRLMTESGRSSNHDYEISHPKVEMLVAELLAVDGVAGARMMGGGEGGSALALIHRDALAQVEKTLDRGYFRLNPAPLPGKHLQVCRFGPGARIEALPGRQASSG